MKHLRILAAILALILSLSLVACTPTENGDETTDGATTNNVTT